MSDNDPNMRIWKLLGRIEGTLKLYDDGSEGYAKIRQLIEEFDKERSEEK